VVPCSNGGIQGLYHKVLKINMYVFQYVMEIPRHHCGVYATVAKIIVQIYAVFLRYLPLIPHKQASSGGILRLMFNA
jgi:hypothetical protein